MKSIRKLLIAIAFTAALLSFPRPANASSAAPVHGRNGMVASVNRLASQAGVEIMQRGGNAVDAAVAVGFVLAVVHPEAGNLGGGGFMLFRSAGGDTHFLDYRETAPAAATRNMYLDAQGNVIPDASVIGYKAIAVPGSVAGMVYAEKHYGKLSLPAIMAPAIKLARYGFPLSYFDAQILKDSYLAQFSESRRIFQSNPQRGGRFYEEGDTLRQLDLAKTLERISKNPDDFYHGDLARRLAASVQKGGGLITEKDLSAYQVRERAVVRGAYRGYDVISAPPPSSGGIVLLETLNILESVPLSSMGNRSAAAMHWTVEAFRRAFMDRAEFLGDPDFAKLPVAQLLDPKYAAAWRATINPERATPSKDLKRPAEFNQLDRSAEVHLPPEHNQTTHYSVVDKEGNAVAVTTTLNDEFGSRVTAEGLGVLLNNEMDDFASKPGTPNMFGLIQGEANAIGPGKRPLSSMVPTIVLKDGKLFMVLGSPGGPRIITTVANIVMGVIDYGLNIQEAVNAPRFHQQWLPDSIIMEKVGFSPDTLKLLQSEGYSLDPVDSFSDGECIMIDPATGERLGASDPRNGGAAEAY